MKVSKKDLVYRSIILVLLGITFTSIWRKCCVDKPLYDQSTIGLLKTLEQAKNHNWSAHELNMLGNVYLMYGFNIDALRVYKEACGIDSTNIWYHYDMALAYAACDDKNLAIDTMEEAMYMAQKFDDKDALNAIEASLQLLRGHYTSPGNSVSGKPTESVRGIRVSP